MTAICPECGAKQEGEPGQSLLCPACMGSFVVPLVMRAPTHFDVRMPDGTMWEEASRVSIREAIYCNRIPIGSRLRAPEIADGAWQPVYTWPEFFAVFHLLGVEPPVASGTRRLAGWRGVERVAPIVEKAVSRPVIDKHDVKAVKVWARGLPVPLIGAVAILVLFAVVTMLGYLWAHL